MHSQRFLATLFLAASAIAQTTAVFPSDHATVPNGAFGEPQAPFGYGISRMMIGLEGWDLAVPVGHSITAVGFRQDGVQATTGCTLQLEVRMGYTNRTSDTFSGALDTNYSAPPVTVFGPAPFVLPSLPSSPGGAPVMVPLSTPFVYAGGNLVVELRISGNSNGNGSFIYYVDRASFVSPVVNGQQGCLSSTMLRTRLTADPTQVGDVYRATVTNLVPNGIGMFFATLDAMPASTFPLTPWVPGVDPECVGQIALANAAVVPFIANASGSAAMAFSVPNSITWYHQVVTAQVAAADFGVVGGLTASNAAQVTCGILPANVLVIGQGAADAALGNVYARFGLVMLFEHQ